MENRNMTYMSRCNECYVMDTPHGFVFPPNIPGSRGKWNTVAMFLLSMVFLCIGACLLSHEAVGSILIASWVYILYQLLCRLCLLIEELRHLQSRYNGDVITIMADALTLKKEHIIIILVLVTFHLISHISYFDVLNYRVVGLCCISMFVLFIGKIVNFESCPLHDSQQIVKFNGLDYGSGMAYSFFYGYLQQLVLPRMGSEDKNLRELMEDYENRERVKFAVHKLFILIPLSLYCPVSLEDKSENIEKANSLDKKKITRAGVTRTVYKNSVYKINSADCTTGSKKRTYVCAEYAAPLKIFHDIVSTRTPHSDVYRKHKKELVLQFYRTLKNVLKDNPDCNKYCEVIYFNDKDENGEYLNVGDVILNRIERIKATRRT